VSTEREAGRKSNEQSVVTMCVPGFSPSSCLWLGIAIVGGSSLRLKRTPLLFSPPSVIATLVEGHTLRPFTKFFSFQRKISRYSPEKNCVKNFVNQTLKSLGSSANVAAPKFSISSRSAQAMLESFPISSTRVSSDLCQLLCVPRPMSIAGRVYSILRSSTTSCRAWDWNETEANQLINNPITRDETIDKPSGIKPLAECMTSFADPRNKHSISQAFRRKGNQVHKQIPSDRCNVEMTKERETETEESKKVQSKKMLDKSTGGTTGQKAGVYGEEGEAANTTTTLELLIWTNRIPSPRESRGNSGRGGAAVPRSFQSFRRDV
jgi:hypothetical protein